MKLYIFGKQGRMSLAIRALALLDKKITLIEAPESGCAMIDFTAPAAFKANLELALQKRAAYMVGTTGFSEDQFQSLHGASQKIPILWAPNTSFGANVLFELTRIASKALAEFKIEIHDIHHQHKKDSPSGTALALERAAGRPSQVTSTRTGEVAGVHEVLFTGPSETILLKHEALNREVFAEGALRAAFFLSGQKPGLYTMQDVLGFHK